MQEKLIRLPEVMQRVGLSRSTIYARINRKGDTFPKPIKLGERAIGWPSSSIDAWIEEMIQKAS
jgi:prophage regulatory protein